MQILPGRIQGCFDNFDHNILRELLRKRIKDKSILRLIDLWLKAGIIDGKSMHTNTKGTPQGNIISPLLCNIYLHYVLDQWIEETVKPLLQGECHVVRYADDFVICFENHKDAKRVMQTLPKRMGKYGLTIHPQKSKLMKFVPDEGRSKSPTFDFLGFTHFWTKSAKGRPVVRRKTCKKSQRKAMKNMHDTCKKHRHEKIREQYKLLKSKLQGIYQYFGIRGNSASIKMVYYKCREYWYKWLNRRSQRKSYTWKAFGELMLHFNLPLPKVVHQNV